LYAATSTFPPQITMYLAHFMVFNNRERRCPP
jgi:hypothetical protein